MKKIIFFLLFVASPFISLITTAEEITGITPKIIKLQTSEIPKKYAGVYKLNDNFQVTISIEDNKLYALAPGDQEKSEFTLVSGSKFSMKSAGAEIEFVEENGKQYLLVKMKDVLKLEKISWCRSSCLLFEVENTDMNI